MRGFAGCQLPPYAYAGFPTPQMMGMGYGPQQAKTAGDRAADAICDLEDARRNQVATDLENKALRQRLALTDRRRERSRSRSPTRSSRSSSYREKSPARDSRSGSYRERSPSGRPSSPRPPPRQPAPLPYRSLTSTVVARPPIRNPTWTAPRNPMGPPTEPIGTTVLPPARAGWAGFGASCHNCGARGHKAKQCQQRAHGGPG